MSIMDKIKGKTFLAIGKTIDVVFDILIKILMVLMDLTKGLSRIIVGILGAVGLLLVGFLFLPMFLLVLFNIPIVIALILLALLPVLAKSLVKEFSYLQEVLTEYFYDKADEILDDKKARFKTLREYKEEYKRREYEEFERRQRQAYEEQRRREEEFNKRIFEEFFGNFTGGNFGGGYSSGGYNTGGQGPSSMGYGFKDMYEKSCDVLEVPYSSDFNTIKTAYRKKAKEYHPDINKSEGATEMFQKVNNAYEFLTEENVNRYRSM